MQLHVDVVSAEGQLYSGQANLVIIPAEQGDVGIAPRHAPLLSRIRPGALRIQREGEADELYYVSGGLLEVQPHMVTVMADTAERAHEIDEQAAQEAKERAQKAMAGQTEKVSLQQAQRELTEAEVRLRLIRQLKTEHKH